MLLELADTMRADILLVQEEEQQTTDPLQMEIDTPEVCMHVWRNKFRVFINEILHYTTSTKYIIN